MRCTLNLISEPLRLDLDRGVEGSDEPVEAEGPSSSDVLGEAAVVLLEGCGNLALLEIAVSPLPPRLGD